MYQREDIGMPARGWVLALLGVCACVAFAETTPGTARVWGGTVHRRLLTSTGRLDVTLFGVRYEEGRPIQCMPGLRQVLPSPPALPPRAVVEVRTGTLFYLGAAVSCVLTAGPIVRRARGRARARRGRCVTCGYDLRASRGRCPECGRPRLDAPAVS